MRVRTLILLLGIFVFGCETAPMDVPPPTGQIQAPPIHELSGTWRLLVDFSQDGVYDAQACIFITNDGYVTVFNDTCSPPNLIVSPAVVLRDNIGPYFLFNWSGIGSVGFYFTWVNANTYILELDTPFGDRFGEANRI